MRVLKWTVPVDDQPHEIGGGKIVLVACQVAADEVQVWTEEHDDGTLPRSVQVIGTGQPFDPTASHVGSALAPHGLVWHVYEAGA